MVKNHTRLKRNHHGRHPNWKLPGREQSLNIYHPKTHGISKLGVLEIPKPCVIQIQTPLFRRVQWFLGQWRYPPRPHRSREAARSFQGVCFQVEWWGGSSTETLQSHDCWAIGLRRGSKEAKKKSRPEVAIETGKWLMLQKSRFFFEYFFCWHDSFDELFLCVCV